MDCDETCDCCCDGIGGSVPFIPENAFCQTDSGNEEPCPEVEPSSISADEQGGNAGQGGQGGGRSVPLTPSSIGQGGSPTASVAVEPLAPVEISQDVGTPAWALVLLLVVAGCLTTIAYRNLTSEEQN